MEITQNRQSQVYGEAKQTIAEKHVIAEQRNCDLLRPGEKTLFLDIDTPEQLAQYERMLPLAMRFQLKEIARWSSRNGHLHIELELPYPLDAAERFCLQAVLGSDPLRELISLDALISTGEDRSALFRPRVPPSVNDIPW